MRMCGRSGPESVGAEEGLARLRKVLLVVGQRVVPLLVCAHNTHTKIYICEIIYIYIYIYTAPGMRTQKMHEYIIHKHTYKIRLREVPKPL
jgi:hypothetical protein